MPNLTCRRANRSFAGLVSIATLCLSGCGGGAGTPMGSVVNSPGGGAPPPTQLVNVKLTVTVPAQTRRNEMDPNYLSSGTQSLSVQLASVDGNGVTGVNSSVVNTTPKSGNCKMQGGGTVCTANISGSPGNDVFSVTTFDELNASGTVLSVGTVSAPIGKGGSGLGISNRLSVDIDGVIASLRLRVSPKSTHRGNRDVSKVSLVAFDASGAQIVGSSNYQLPIALTIQGDATGSYALHAGGMSGSQLTINRPTSDLTLSYDGNRQASSVTVQASIANTDPISADAPFTLIGRRPPPPPGTIYVLNLGTNSGLGATVTEYDGNADGNVAPLRTLDLDPKLYARGITVDSSGNLYVGYLDSSLGFAPSSGRPDAGNLVAIYASGASGNAQPTATLKADPTTQTALFPIDPVINAAGGLVTYGATTVDKNTGDAVLTYPAGASGATAPSHGWSFYSPSLYYAGPTGLALDAAGNFYVNGALHTALGPSYGVFIVPVSDIGNPYASPARTIPWDSTTQLPAGSTTNVALDPSGEIAVANALVQSVNSVISCQGRVNVFAAGATGGVTDVPPLRVLVLKGIYTQNSLCVSQRSPIQPYFPTITLYGDSLFAVDPFNDAVDAFPSGKGGTVSPTTHIAGSATGLAAPVAIFVASSSGHARPRPVKSGRI